MAAHHASAHADAAAPAQAGERTLAVRAARFRGVAGCFRGTPRADWVNRRRGTVSAYDPAWIDSSA